MANELPAMKKIRTICALSVPLLFIACSQKAFSVSDEIIDSLEFTISPFTNGDVTTKTSFVDGGGFLWAPDDTVGIYPDTGSQIWFELNAGAEASSAQFDGGGWTFKESSVYYSYYPFIGDIYLNRNHIPVSYSGQKQIGTESTSHIGPYDFMYTPGSSSASGNVNFRYRHLNSLLYLRTTLPAGTYTKMAITAPIACFVEKGWYDLMAEQPTIVADTYVNQLTIDLAEVTLSAQTTFLVYMMMAPVNLNGIEVTVSALNTAKKEYQCQKTPSREYIAGSYYGLTCSSFTEVPQSMGLIIGDWGDGGNIGGDAD